MININYSNELNNFDHIKTTAMLSIVVYHSMALWMPGGWFTQPPAEANYVLGHIAQWLNFLHIYIFVFASGYLYSYLRVEIKKYGTYKELLVKKAKRLLIPYFFVSAVWCVPLYKIFYDATSENIILNFVFGFGPSQLWFLLMLFVTFAIIYYPTPYICSLSIRKMAVLCLLIYILYLAIGVIISLPFQIGASIKFIPYFILGMNFNKYSTYIKAKMKWLVFLMINLTSYFLYCILPDGFLTLKIIKSILPYFISIAGIFFIISLFNKFQNRKIWRSKIYKFLLNNSFSIYLFHQQIIWWTITIWNGILPPVLLAVMNFGVSLFLSALISVVLNRFKVTRFLIGG